MVDLSGDESVCLELCARGRSLAPIGRWKEPVLSLASKGLLTKLDDSNYVISPSGRTALKDDEVEEDEALAAMLNRHYAVQRTQEGIVKFIKQAADYLAEAGLASQKALGHSPEHAIREWSKLMIEEALRLVEEKRKRAALRPGGGRDD